MTTDTELQEGLRLARLRASEKDKVKAIRAEIFRLIKEADRLETVHWYCWVDQCFENDEFQDEEFKSLQWRMMALKSKGEPVGYLAALITPILQAHGLVDEQGREITTSD